MLNLGIVFPGQGAQYVGMGQGLHDDFEAARQCFYETSRVLDEDISGICFEGPQEKLNLTVFTQLTVFTVNMAAYSVFRKAVPLKPVVMAGHSLGEFSALCAAGAIELADILPLIRKRATYQQEAVPPGEGLMAAVMGLDTEAIELLCKEAARDGGIVEPANYNGPSQTVISGSVEAVERAICMAREMGARRVLPLPISVPCHCSLLEEAAKRLENALKEVRIGDCSIPVIPNLDPSRDHSASTTKDLLVKQLYSPVRWQETIERMIEMGVDTIIEIGPKKSLSGLIKRMDDGITLCNIEDRTSLEKTMQVLGL